MALWCGWRNRGRVFLDVTGCADGVPARSRTSGDSRGSSEVRPPQPQSSTPSAAPGRRFACCVPRGPSWAGLASPCSRAAWPGDRPGPLRQEASMGSPCRAGARLPGTPRLTVSLGSISCTSHHGGTGWGGLSWKPWNNVNRNSFMHSAHWSQNCWAPPS